MGIFEKRRKLLLLISFVAFLEYSIMGRRAAGFLVYRLVSSEIQYLLLKASYGSFHWTPPKGEIDIQKKISNHKFSRLGHVDPGEDDYTTALRETREEAGFTEQDMKIHKSLTKTLNYQVKGKNKVVIYWLAEIISGKDPILSDEHTEFKFLSKNEVSKFSSFPDFLEMLDYFDAEIKKIHQIQ